MEAVSLKSPSFSAMKRLKVLALLMSRPMMRTS